MHIKIPQNTGSQLLWKIIHGFLAEYNFPGKPGKWQAAGGLDIVGNITTNNLCHLGNLCYTKGSFFEYLNV